MIVTRTCYDLHNCDHCHDDGRANCDEEYHDNCDHHLLQVSKSAVELWLLVIWIGEYLTLASSVSSPSSASATSITITLLTFEFWHRPQCNGLYFLASHFSFYYLECSSKIQPRDTNQSDKISAHRRWQSWKSEDTFYRNDLLFVVKSLRRLQGGDLYKWHHFNEFK